MPFVALKELCLGPWRRGPKGGIAGQELVQDVLLEGNRYVCAVVAGDLQEYTAVWTTLVSLAGGVKKTGPKAENGGGVLLVAYEVTGAIAIGVPG